MKKRARLVIIEPQDAVERFKAINQLLAQHLDLAPVSILFEGVLASLWQPADTAAADGSTAKRRVVVHNLGFGCPCCIGSLPLSVTLTRVLRQEKPELIILAPLPGAHLDSLGRMLAEKFSCYLEFGPN